ncbi:hypothetical protein GCM10007860_06710 [Chitiniphilus shinanonensis]|uniref:Outer membrane protein assembly factor BamE domain-containing protein n=1 Tax=Chitiniphilus shinanonensis TaxID=553088 RepID=A0ABQ6BQE0_9NEIS|nr:DUF3862 domain-containing protein [Chitiniphilus shinanonensis]GLS03527.1 hypothetical protein GCM10007860_06710 [Chitiniphilus shinanonensis]
MRPLLLCLLLLSLVACSRLTQENYAKIETGMTRERVVEILGEPDQSDSGSLLGISGEHAQWKSGGTTVTVQFVNDKVMTKDMEKR